MSHGVYEYLEYVGNSLLTNTEITAFCTANFRKSIKIFIGQDEADLPTDDFCPMIIFTAGARGTTGNDRLKTRSSRITIAIKNEEKAKATSTGIVKYAGCSLLEELADLVAKALVNITPHPSGYYASELGDGPEDQISFPVFKAFLSLSISLDSDF